MNKKEIYFEICNKFNTNLNEVFNYLCEDFQQMKNNDRFEILQNIFYDNYNFNEILIGFKNHYNYNEIITFPISLSLLSIIRYIKRYHTNDPDDDVSILILESQVRGKRVGEERLLPIIINYFETGELLYK